MMYEIMNIWHLLSVQLSDHTFFARFVQFFYHANHTPSNKVPDEFLESAKASR
jgi:hypothetical protein